MDLQNIKFYFQPYFFDTYSYPWSYVCMNLHLLPIATYLCSHIHYINSILLLPAVNLTKTTTTALTSAIQESVNSLCGDGTNMLIGTGSVGGVMGLIILTQIMVIVVLLLRQSAKGKANNR